MQHKKGQVGIAAVVISAVILLVLIGNVLAPIISDARSAQTAFQQFERVDAPNDEDFTLTKATQNLALVDGSLDIGSLVQDANYSVNYTSGVVTINTSVNATLNGTYEYHEANFIENTTERTLFGIVLLGAIIGVAYMIFKALGLID